MPPTNYIIKSNSRIFIRLLGSYSNENPLAAVGAKIRVKPKPRKAGMVLGGSMLGVSGTSAFGAGLGSSASHESNQSGHSHSPSLVLSQGEGRAFLDEPSSFALDQLHAEQKSTIEALGSQVELYRRREERLRGELDALRGCLGEGAGQADVARLARERREAGEALDAARAKLQLGEAERARVAQQRAAAERQLRDARHTIAGFAQAVEQLEVKMQRKEAEVQARCLELEQQLRDKALECAGLAAEAARERESAAKLQAASDESDRARQDLAALVDMQSLSGAWRPATSAFSAELQGLFAKMQRLESDKQLSDDKTRELEQKLLSARTEATAAQLETERKQSEIKELKAQLENSSNLLALREQLLSTDGNMRKESEQQRQELMALISGLQREKSDLQHTIASLQAEYDAAKEELATAKTRMTFKDHSVVVATLKGEIASLKDRLCGEYKLEKENLEQEKTLLNQENSDLHSRLLDKDRMILSLQREAKKAEEKQQQFAYEERHCRDQIGSLRRELEQARAQYQQLQSVRTSLADQLDVGFKALLENEDSAGAAREESASLRRELVELKKQHAKCEVDQRLAIEQLESARRQHDEGTSRLNDKIDDLYRQLIDKDDATSSLINAQRRLELAEEEKATWEGQVTDMRLRSERRLEVEVRKVEDLRAKVDQLAVDKANLSNQIVEMEAQAAESAQQLRELQSHTEDTKRQLSQEQSELYAKIAKLEVELGRSVETSTAAQQDKKHREKKLLREREVLEREMTKLVARIEQLGSRNLTLGNKVVELAKQSKADQTNVVALNAQVKSYKRQLRQLQQQLGDAVRSASSHDLTLQLREASCRSESYKLEVNKLQEALENVQHDLEAALQDRDESDARARALAQCQEHMKAAAEGHTVELVEEIEALQHQLESERKRCAKLLANEKTLVRDLQERNAAIGKLQRSISAARVPIAPPVSKGRRDSVSSTSSSSSRRHRSHGEDSPVTTKPRRGDADSSISTATMGTATTAPEVELEQLLRNLEHISALSPSRERELHH